jgi:RsiW-degrading membrane proteinase PrsW (M82 family)
MGSENKEKAGVYVRYLPVVVIVVVAVASIICAGVFMGRETVMSAAMAATAIPAILTLAYIYRSDRIEPEPAGLLYLLFILGIIVSIPAMGLSILAMRFFSGAVVIAFIALAEEFCKYAALYLATWKHSAFNYRFDGVVYGATVAIGFEVAQAILMLGGNAGRAALTAAVIPIHCIFGIYMGFFYGQAKVREKQKDERGTVIMGMLAIIFPVVLHCVYSMLTSDPEAEGRLIAFVAFILILSIAAFISVRQFSKVDRKI